jgi:hypothetical protein
MYEYYTGQCKSTADNWAERSLWVLEVCMVEGWL